MPKIVVTAEDLKSILTMEAGWKKATLKAVAHNPSKGKDSMNYEFEWSVENDSNDFRPIKTWINDKNKKMFIVGLQSHYEALMDVKMEQGQQYELEPEKWIGLTCWLDISKDIQENGTIYNSVVGFSPNSKIPF